MSSTIARTGPTTARAGRGARHVVVTSPIGELTLCADGAAMTGVYFEGHRHPPDVDRLGVAVGVEDDPVLATTRDQLREYFARQRADVEVPLAPVGAAFQQRVWSRLRAIGYGERATYGQLAQDLGSPRLARAVGAAVGRNPLSILIPCHRVVGGDGALTGFAGGLERKRYLLDLEAGGTLF